MRVSVVTPPTVSVLISELSGAVRASPVVVVVLPVAYIVLAFVEVFVLVVSFAPPQPAASAASAQANDTARDFSFTFQPPPPNAISHEARADKVPPVGAGHRVCVSFS